MTTSQARGIKHDTLNDSSVAEYLQTHPDFFERNGPLLSRLRLPHLRDAGATVSLVERQVEVLRERNQALERRLKELVDVARANDALADRIHRLSQRLIRAHSLPETIDALETSLREDFEARNSVLVLFLDQARTLEAAPGRFLRTANSTDAEIKSFESLLHRVYGASDPRQVAADIGEGLGAHPRGRLAQLQGHGGIMRRLG